MKKIVMLLFILIMPVVIFGGCSCSYETNPYKTIQSGDRFVITKELTTQNTVYVEMYDKNTKVMYCYIKLSNSGSFEVLLNADGTPMLWEGEL